MKQIDVKDRLKKIEASLDEANRIDRFDDRVKSLTHAQQLILDEILNIEIEGEPDIVFKEIEGETFLDEANAHLSPQELLNKALNSNELWEEQAAAGEFIRRYGQKLLDIAEAANRLNEPQEVSEYEASAQALQDALAALEEEQSQLKGSI